MTPRQIRELFEIAMKDRAPEAYSTMKEAGELKEYLDQMTGQAWESILEARQMALNDPTFRRIEGHLTKVQQSFSRIKIAEEVAIAQGLEEIDAMGAPDPDELEENPNLYEITGDNLDRYLERGEEKTPDPVGIREMF